VFALNALSMIRLAVVLFWRRTATVTAGAPASGSGQGLQGGCRSPRHDRAVRSIPIRLSVYLLPASVLLGLPLVASRQLGVRSGRYGIMFGPSGSARSPEHWLPRRSPWTRYGCGCCTDQLPSPKARRWASSWSVRYMTRGRSAPDAGLVSHSSSHLPINSRPRGAA
jgi:hypothetical protein